MSKQHCYRLPGFRGESGSFIQFQAVFLCLVNDQITFGLVQRWGLPAHPRCFPRQVDIYTFCSVIPTVLDFHPLYNDWPNHPLRVAKAESCTASELLDRNCPSRIKLIVDREVAPILKLNTCPSTMITLTKPRIIAVLGATGNQGSGVVRALLQKDPYHPASFSVRAVTRDPSSPQAERLRIVYPEEEASGRLQLVPGDVYDVTSLERAFDGVWGVFAVTNNRIPGQMIETEEDLEHELVAGRNIVAAAKASGVRHFVISSLPNLADASKGQFQKVFHFDHKFQIEQLAKSELTAVTALRPGE